MRRFPIVVIAIVGVTVFASPAFAGRFYLNPNIGAAFPMAEKDKPTLGVGLAAGYTFTSYLAAGVGYTYLHPFGTYRIENDRVLDGTHMFDVNATLFKNLKVITPYMRIGVGAYRMTFTRPDDSQFQNLGDPDPVTEPLLNVGAGIRIHPIPFLGLTIGVAYHALSGTTDFVEPVATLGFSLGK